MPEEIKFALTDQFRRTLEMFQDAVQAFDTETWLAPNQDGPTAAGIALHTLETIEFYFSDQPPDEFPWGQRFEVDWEAETSDKLPSPPKILEYMQEIQGKIEAWLDAADLLETDSLHPYTGEIKLGRALYVLRHSQHHTADLARLLTEKCRPAPDWR